jgi:hypothetical protein
MHGFGRGGFLCDQAIAAHCSFCAISSWRQAEAELEWRVPESAPVRRLRALWLLFEMIYEGNIWRVIRFFFRKNLPPKFIRNDIFPALSSSKLCGTVSHTQGSFLHSIWLRDI